MRESNTLIRDYASFIINVPNDNLSQQEIDEINDYKRAVPFFRFTTSQDNPYVIRDNWLLFNLEYVFQKTITRLNVSESINIKFKTRDTILNFTSDYLFYKNVCDLDYTLTYNRDLNQTETTPTFSIRPTYEGTNLWPKMINNNDFNGSLNIQYPNSCQDLFDKYLNWKTDPPFPNMVQITGKPY